MQLLKQYTSFLVNTTCTAVTDAGVMIREADGTTRLLPADSVVLAAGMRSYDPLSDDIRYLAPEYRAIGDCHQVGNLKGATHGAYGCVMDIQ